MTRTPPPLPIVTDAALPAWHHLVGRLTSATDDGMTVPCRVVPSLFTSEDKRERRTAATWCSACPAAAACAEFAVTNGERFGVWGGIDRSPRPMRQTTTTTTTKESAR